MPQYKLTYFDLRGWAEPARQLLHLSHTPYDDVRIPMADTEKSWENLKEKTPFGQLPVLNVDGFDIPQSAAICRYLARKFGYAGKNPEEEAWADAIVDQYKDFSVAFKTLIFAARAGKPQEDILKIRYEIFNPSRDAYFEILNKILKDNKSGTCLEKLKALDDDNEDHQKLRKYVEKIYSTPDLEDHIATRMDTEV
ncbi:Protein CBR-GST-15 [Caenorhabditis briggsae]|uniref:Protein CBR-GST-15 n=1 Tax=Caenorhabditis briggsae TaxID=6238 RepID=A8XYB9_CAEBR|nr:Protein CBR-GST-15 [Caenorhabditis briggsae]CAP37636.2 Protein CBR-GST-15 [Caenorhabditis briggsae]